MRVVFMGTPSFAANILEELSFQHEVVAVYTRPDAIRGRGKKQVASPVKEMALRLGLPVLTPQTLRDVAPQEVLAGFEPDAIVVAAYGAILPREVLDIPAFGCLNVHASALPRWRGAAPIERAILAGDEQAGVCIMKMEEGLDTGDFCICRQVEIGAQNATELTLALSDLGARALIVALAQIEADTIMWTAQNEADVTYAHKIEKGELNLTPEVSATQNIARVRASSEPHPAKCILAGKACTVLAASNSSEGVSFDANFQAGQLAYIQKRIFAACEDGVFEIEAIKPDGKREMTAKEFAAGNASLRENNATWEAC